MLTLLQLERIPTLFYQRSDFQKVITLSIEIYALPVHVLTLLSVDEILLLRYFFGLIFNETTAPS